MRPAVSISRTQSVMVQMLMDQVSAFGPGYSKFEGFSAPLALVTATRRSVSKLHMEGRPLPRALFVEPGRDRYGGVVPVIRGT